MNKIQIFGVIVVLLMTPLSVWVDIQNDTIPHSIVFTSIISLIIISYIFKEYEEE